MNPRLLGFLGLAVWLWAGGLAGGAEPSKAPAAVRDAQALAKSIDRHLAKRWAATKVEPAPRADDAEFLRRVYLDLAGRIPSVAEARAFLDDRQPDKRARLIEQLLGGQRYVTHFTNVWRALLLPEAGTSIQARIQQPGFESWLRQRVAANTAYDKLVRELLTTPVAGDGRGGAGAFFGQGGSSPAAFYAAKEYKPENLAGSTARLFLGVRLECAQCHNHPFAQWKREQFWSLAAFFAGIQTQRRGDFAFPSSEDPAKHELAIPGTEKVVQARFIDGNAPKWQSQTSARTTLAEWMTAADNPFFARAAVNRTWAYFFGTGLVEPIDEMVGTEAAPSHPELLDELARQFAAHQFDLKFLVRAITNSQAYQRTSAGTPNTTDDPTQFARRPLKGLSPEQLFDSVAMATGYREAAGTATGLGALLQGDRSARTEFLTKFASQGEAATEMQTSILQALALMNGKVTAAATDLERSETLAAVVDFPSKTGTPGRIETLYLATLSRRPTASELDRLVKFVEKDREGDKDQNYKNALADVFWALLNSPEFILNH